MADNELLSDEELRDEVVTKIAFGRQGGKTAGEVGDEIVRLIQFQKQAAIVGYVIKYKETLQEMDAERQRNSNHVS